MNKMDNEGLTRLLQKYLEKKVTEEERLFVDLWYEQQDQGSQTYLSETEAAIEEEKLWRGIQQKAGIKRVIHNNRGNNYLSRPVQVTWMGIAASLLFAIGWFLLYGQDASWRKEMTELSNTSNQVREFMLEDGTFVTLHPGSLVRVPAQTTGGIREVHMEGEVFFEVKRDPSRPFIVYAGDLVTRVLGTSFLIKEIKNSQQIEVSVKTGKVEVLEINNAESMHDLSVGEAGVVLTPNQKAVYQPGLEKILVGLVDRPLPIQGPGEVSFVYNNVSLGTVATSMNRAYGVEIDLATHLSDCPITADFSQEGFYDKLELICAALQINYTIHGARIELAGRGCEE